MKRTLILSTIILLNIANATADMESALRENILSNAHKAQSGVIVAVTERGEVAAETAWLLSAQVMRNHSYAPLLLALQPEELKVAMKELKLTEQSLPALIFFDRKGREISRVVGALPSQSIKYVRAGTDTALN